MKYSLDIKFRPAVGRDSHGGAPIRREMFGMFLHVRPVWGVLGRGVHILYEMSLSCLSNHSLPHPYFTLPFYVCIPNLSIYPCICFIKKKPEDLENKVTDTSRFHVELNGLIVPCCDFCLY